MSATTHSFIRPSLLVATWLCCQHGFAEAPDSPFLNVRQLNSELTINDQHERYQETRWQIGAGDAEKPRWRFQHDYRVLELPSANGVVAANNGHLHALGWQWNFSYENWQIKLEPTLATSSNALRHLKEVELGDWQAHFALRYEYGKMQFGIAASSLLGRYRTYPVWQWQLADSEWTATLGFPENHLRWTPTQSWQWQLRVAPDGGQWRVRDEELTVVSNLHQRRWRAEIGLTWRWNNIEIGGQVIHHMDQRWRYRLMDNRVNEIDIPDGIAVSFEMVWRL